MAKQELVATIKDRQRYTSKSAEAEFSVLPPGALHTSHQGRRARDETANATDPARNRLLWRVSYCAS